MNIKDQSLLPEFLLSPEDEDLRSMNWSLIGRDREYLAHWVNGKVESMHRTVAFRMGLIDKINSGVRGRYGLSIDHINQNTFDNRRENLRLVNRSTQQYNRTVPKKYLKVGALPTDTKGEASG